MVDSIVNLGVPLPLGADHLFSAWFFGWSRVSGPGMVGTGARVVGRRKVSQGRSVEKSQSRRRVGEKELEKVSREKVV